MSYQYIFVLTQEHRYILQAKKCITIKVYREQQVLIIGMALTLFQMLFK